MMIARALAIVAVLMLVSSVAPGFAQAPATQKPFSPSSNYMSPANFRRLALADLAPKGQLRVAFVPNPVLVSRDSATGQLRGIAPDLAGELATALGVPLSPVDFGNLPPAAILARLLEGATTGAWDLAFTVIESDRLRIMDFSPPYLEIENTYLVPAGSNIRTIADADRPGVRIAVVRGVASDRYLSVALQQAELLRFDTLDAQFEAFRAGRADAMGTSRTNLLALQGRLPGSRILEDRYLVESQAIAIPKGKMVGLIYLTQFTEWAKSTGVVQRAIDRSGVRGVRVPPSASRP